MTMQFRRALWMAVAVVAVSNLFALVHVWRNRSGMPEAEVVLTSRELGFYGRNSESNNVTLHLNWRNPADLYQVDDAHPVPGWADREAVASLGFDTSVPVSSPDASRFYANQRSRGAYIALEYDGEAWQRWLESQPVPEVDTVDRRTELLDGSHLVAIDLGRDPEALRSRYPDRSRVLILPCQVMAMATQPYRPGTAYDPNEPAVLHVFVTQISVASINVPQPWNAMFDPDMAVSSFGRDRRAPPYQVRLRMGSNYEPWVADVTRSQ